MSSIKNKLTVDSFKIMNRALEGHASLFTIRESDKYLVEIIEKDVHSDLFFAVAKEVNLNSGHYVDVVAKPWTSSQNTIGNGRFKIEPFENCFKEWINNLKTYNEDSVFKDLITKGYQEEFYDDFKIVDNDAEEKGFDYGQQLNLLEYLVKVQTEIDQFKTDENSAAIDEIKLEVAKLGEDLTKETKNSTMQRLTLIWAKARKSGFRVSEFMLKEFAKEFLKKGVQLMFNFAAKNAHKLPEYIEHFTTKSLLPPT